MATRTLLFPAAAAAIILLGASARADNLPGSDWVPVMEVVIGIERVGFTPIAKIEAKDGGWRVQAYRRSVLYEIQVDPHANTIKSAAATNVSACGAVSQDAMVSVSPARDEPTNEETPKRNKAAPRTSAARDARDRTPSGKTASLRKLATLAKPGVRAAEPRRDRSRAPMPVRVTPQRVAPPITAAGQRNWMAPRPAPGLRVMPRHFIGRSDRFR